MSDWLDRVKSKATDLRALVLDYHPASRDVHSLKITAPNAEKAAKGIRESIKQKFEGNPVKRFDLALDDGDADTLRSILSDTWFGVPESTDCWRIKGFGDLVDLLDG